MKYADKHGEIIGRENAEWENRLAAQEMEHGRYLAKRNRSLSMARPASPEEYALWIVGHMVNGNDPTHHYNYNMPDDFFVAREGMEIPELYGAASINVIVPHGVNVIYSDIGHNMIYFMDGFRAVGQGWVPMYNDVSAMI